MITKLTNLNTITVPTEPEPEVTPQPPAPPPSSGVAGAPDLYESVDQNAMNYSNMFQEHPAPGSLPAAPIHQSVDASSIFEVIAEPQEPAPPAPPEPSADGLGQTLE